MILVFLPLILTVSIYKPAFAQDAINLYETKWTVDTSAQLSALSGNYDIHGDITFTTAVSSSSSTLNFIQANISSPSASGRYVYFNNQMNQNGSVTFVYPTVLYNSSGWWYVTSSTQRVAITSLTIHVTYGDDVLNSSLLTWFNNNFTLQESLLSEPILTYRFTNNNQNIIFYVQFYPFETTQSAKYVYLYNETAHFTAPMGFNPARNAWQYEMSVSDSSYLGGSILGDTFRARGVDANDDYTDYSLPVVPGVSQTQISVSITENTAIITNVPDSDFVQFGLYRVDGSSSRLVRLFSGNTVSIYEDGTYYIEAFNNPPGFNLSRSANFVYTYTGAVDVPRPPVEPSSGDLLEWLGYFFAQIFYFFDASIYQITSIANEFGKTVTNIADWLSSVENLFTSLWDFLPPGLSEFLVSIFTLTLLGLFIRLIIGLIP